MRKLLLLPALAILLFASAAHAGFYLGGSIGQASFDLEGTSGRFSLDDTGWKVFAGWKFGRFVAVDAGYYSLGSASATEGTLTTKADADSVGLFAVGILPATPRLSLFFKGGFSAWNVDERFSDTAQPAPQPVSSDGTEFGWGFGVSWLFTRHLAVQAEWETLGDWRNARDVKFISLAVKWEF